MNAFINLVGHLVWQPDWYLAFRLTSVTVM